MNNQIDIEDLKNRLAKLFEFIDIDNKRIECKELEIETQKDSFWQNQMRLYHLSLIILLLAYFFLININELIVI